MSRTREIHRVVVTGLGAVTPIGNTVEEFWDGLRSGRNGIGLANALENRIIGTKSRGVYEAPGMELLGTGLRSVYQAVLDRRSTSLFGHVSRLVAEATYDGRLYDPASRAALGCVDVLAWLP